MRFNKTPRHAFENTPRKRARVLSRQRAERDAFPLFAEQIAEDQPTVSMVMATRAERWGQTEARMRAHLAQAWRKVRRAYFALDEPTRQLVASEWKAWPGPAMPTYLHYLVRRAAGTFPGENEPKTSKG